MKFCPKCNQTKSLSEFYGIKKLGSYCKPCCKIWAQENKDRRNEYQRTYRKRHPEQVRNYVRKIEYKNDFGITITDYDKLFQEQNGYCGICGRHQSVFSIRLAIDHDHITGKIRGLLCSSCNLGLGALKEYNLQKAIVYLSKIKAVI